MRSTSPTPSPSSSLNRPASREHAAVLEGLARLSTDVFSEKPFAGLEICVTGLSKEARKQVQMMTERMGGHYSPDLHGNCTHLVVQSCSGRKFEHALKHGLHRGLYVVTLPWFLNSAKQFERLDESLYSVQQSIPDAITPDNFSGAIGNSSWQNSCIPSSCDLGSAYRQNTIASKTRSSGGSIKTSASTPRTPHSTYTTQTSNTKTVLSGARFYVDPALPEDLQAKVQEAVESWGATCVEIFSKNNNTTHVVCGPNSLSKYIGLNLHLVSPMWVLSARDGFPLRCVQYSADLARNVADLLSVKDSNTLLKSSTKSYGRPANARTADAHLRDRQEKASAAKAGVRRRRGPRMQPCRTLPRPTTPITLLESICWAVTDTPAAAEMYTDRSGKVTLENGDTGNGYEDDHSQYRELGKRDSSKEFYTRVLSESEKRTIVFRGAFLTILFPIDRFSELGPSSRTFFSEGGFSREQIIELIHSFYQELLSPEEINAAIHTDSKHADRLRATYTSEEVDELGYVPMLRAEFLGSRRHFEGLKRIGQEPTSSIYELWLVP
jgi:hypothetical protein